MYTRGVWVWRCGIRMVHGEHDQSWKWNEGPCVVNSELKYTLAYTHTHTRTHTHTHTHTHIHYTDIETGLCTPHNQPREPLIPCSHERTSCELLHNGWGYLTNYILASHPPPITLNQWWQHWLISKRAMMIAPSCLESKPIIPHFLYSDTCSASCIPSLVSTK